MIEQILTRKNLLQAMHQVQKNHGSAGVDHMPVTKLSELLPIDKEELTAKVRSGEVFATTHFRGRDFEREGENQVTWYSHGNRPFASTSGVAGYQCTV